MRASLLDFALFQAFFPKFAAGPIIRSSGAPAGRGDLALTRRAMVP